MTINSGRSPNEAIEFFFENIVGRFVRKLVFHGDEYQLESTCGGRPRSVKGNGLFSRGQWRSRVPRHRRINEADLNRLIDAKPGRWNP
jgi:hypothetical protein